MIFADYDGRWAAFFGIVAIAVFVGCVYGGVMADASQRATEMKALNLWLADCHGPLEECTNSWDRSYTLRRIYLAKAED